jgi:signal transduction histidine kinase
VNINLEMGLVLVALGKKTEGFNLLKTNIETAKMLCNEDAITTGLDNLSNSYFEVGDYENSLRYQLVLSEYPDIIYSSTEYKAGFNQHLAEIFIQLKRWDEAQKHTTLALRYASDMGSNDWLFDCYKNQSAIYEAKGKFKEALDYHKKYLSTKDAVYKSDYDTKMSAMANLYELEHQQNQITQLTTEKQTASVKAERLTYVTGFLILILSLVFTFYQYRKKNAEKDLQQKIAFQLLQAQEEERQRISGELHDSIGQNLLFLKNQLRNDLSPETKAHVMKSVDDALEEIRNISKNLYPNQLEKFGLVAAVEALAAEVRSNSGIFISSDMEGIDDVLNKNVKINFYRIIQEFVNNTLKHAEATAIRITAREINDTIELIVQDNGKGFDMADVERKANSSFGLLNMEERIKMLKGKINIESSIGKGTKSVFIVPV